MRKAPVRAILAFLAIAYALSVALSLLVAFTGGYQSALIGLGWLTMFIPAIAVLVVRFALDEKVTSLDWARVPLPYLPVALLLMPIVLHVAMLTMTAKLEGRLPWEPWLTRAADGLYHTPASRGWGTLTLAGLAARIAMNAGVGLVVVSAVAFFEEIGWRAWLLPRLLDRMSARRAVALSALLYAFWHTPFALSGIHHLDGVSATQTALIMLIGIAGAGVVFGWLWCQTESIWIVMLAHGALNNWGQFAFKFMQPFAGAENAGEENALILCAGNLALLALGGVLLWRGFPSASRHVANNERPNVAPRRPMRVPS